METTQKIHPTFDKVVIKLAKANTTTASGFIIPETAAKDKPVQGVVESVGPQVSEVKPGDTVIFPKYGPDEFMLGEDRYYILKQENILAVIK